MICTIKNIKGSIQTLNGHEFQIDEVYNIGPECLESWNTTEVMTAIDNEELVCLRGEIPLGIKTSKEYINNGFDSCLAVDKNNSDQSISGNDWTHITAGRILWDNDSDYDLENSQFIIPFDGVYFHDGQFKIKNIASCTSIELVIFKKIVDQPDDYWFILDKKEIGAGQTECQLSSATNFDFYEDEQYIIKIKLYGENASATMDGNDDFTAWGYSFMRKIL